MPKFLKIILNFFAVVTALAYFFVVCAYPIYWIMGWRTKAGLWLLTLIPIALHRVPIMLGEFRFLRPYLSGNDVNKELFKINMYVVFSLFLGSILCAGIFLRQVNRWIPLREWQYLLWVLITLIAGLVAVAEVYIKTDYFKEKHLTTHQKKVARLLSFIIIPMYVLPVAGVAFYLYMKS